MGQLHVSGDLDLSRASNGSQTISGLAQPDSSHSLTPLQSSASGWAHWYQVSNQQADTIRLVGDVAMPTPQNGLMIRFQAASDAYPGLYVGYQNSPSYRLLDSEKNELTQGRFRSGQIIQAQWQDSAFFLSNAPTSGCPSGYLNVNGSFCIQQDDNASVDWFQANAACETQGASLCTFADYIHACRAVGTQMNGLFNNWEWIDDTSDHTHTADQAGRWNCFSNRSRGATNVDFANYRCCYLLK